MGSFAVIGVLLLVLAQFAFFASVGRETPLWVLVFVPAVSRCCSALAVTVQPAMSTSQYAEQKKPRGHVAVLSAMLLSFLTAAVMFCGRYALFLGAVLAGYGLTLRQGYRSLGGMNGDIAGAALPMCVEKQALAAEGRPSGPVLKPGGGPGQPDLLRIGAAAEMTIYLIRHGKTGVLYEQDPRFREVDFGIFEMQSYEELKDRPDYQI